MAGTTMAGHIYIMIIEHLMKLDIILKIVGCSVTKKLDHNRSYSVPADVFCILLASVPPVMARLV